MTRKKEKPIKTTSKRTGAIILILFVAFVIGGTVFMIFAYYEADKQTQLENDWRMMSCEEMRQDVLKVYESWKVVAMMDKECQ